MSKIKNINWVDAHHHLWKISRGDYEWLNPSLKTLYKDFEIEELNSTLKHTPIKRTIVVQAAPTIAETKYLLDIANDNDTIQGVVGWIDFEKNAVQDLRNLATNSKLKAIRPMLQDIENKEWILNKKFNEIFDLLVELDLVFDALIHPNGLKSIYKIAKKYTNLKIVINHAAKPKIRNGRNGKDGFNMWQKKITKFKDLLNVNVKFSGLLTEARENATFNDLQPYADCLMSVFGENRIIWGSDWPVLNLATNYNDWLEFSNTWFDSLGYDIKLKIVKSNAEKIYTI